jgi:hypothetical protein
MLALFRTGYAVLITLTEAWQIPPLGERHLSNPLDTMGAVHRIRTEIERLTVVQIEALKNATFLGMTPDDAKEYDARRAEIVKLVELLTALEKAA